MDKATNSNREFLQIEPLISANSWGSYQEIMMHLPGAQASQKHSLYNMHTAICTARHTLFLCCRTVSWQMLGWTPSSRPYPLVPPSLTGERHIFSVTFSVPPILGKELKCEDSRKKPWHQISFSEPSNQTIDTISTLSALCTRTMNAPTRQLVVFLYLLALPFLLLETYFRIICNVQSLQFHLIC